jgi:hypothetical protein
VSASLDHVRAVSAFGFTERQAQFLILVMLHSGVCVGRQYCTFARIVRGQKVYNFFAKLVAKRYVSVYTAVHSQARMYHLHAKPLYRAVGQVDNRHRRPVGLGRAIERLMVLDAVLAAPQITWLGTEQEKVRHFTLATPLRRDELPRLVFGSPPQITVRYFPDKLPIGISADRRTHIFLYLVTRAVPVDFRVFLYRHAELLRALADWMIKLLVPRYLVGAVSVYEAATLDEFSPLSPGVLRELRWYFQQRQTGFTAGDHADRLRRTRAAAVFSAPRFRVLYRTWLRSGDTALDAAASPVLADAMRRGTGRIETEVLPHDYQFLLPLVGTS